MSSKHLIVGAIDFGTTYSGWASSFIHEFESDPTKASLKQWNSGSSVTQKTPTCVLIRPDGETLEAFGYEAENRYRDLFEAGEHRCYYYFRRFKMFLYKKLGEKLGRGTTMEDEMGNSLVALDVFAAALKYLKDDMMTAGNQRITGILEESDVRWVITVPAIWNDAAKQFMREAAEMAGMETNQLTIALEPEAASIYCRHLSFETVSEQSVRNVSAVRAGTRYLVLDAGGGTIDITVHEVDQSGRIKEVHAASGGGWGGIMVDQAFEDMLVHLFTSNSNNIYVQFKAKETEDWLDFWRVFEIKKRAVCPESSARITMTFPATLIEMYKVAAKQDVSEAISRSKYSGELEFEGNKMKFTAKVFKSFFSESIKNTIDHVRVLLKKNRDVKEILMVGGYSESPMMQHAVKTAFPEVDVVIPLSASSSILRGALIYGHKPKSIVERVLKYTYGVGTMVPFEAEKHPISKRVKTANKGDQCKDVFDKHVEKDQVVIVGEHQVRQSYFAIETNQSFLTFAVYASYLKNAKFIDKDCFYVGGLDVDITDPDDDLSREVEVSLTFSGTEIIVDAEDKKTERKYNATLDFLG